MEIGALFGLQASFDQIESVSRLITEHENLKTATEKQDLSSEVLNDFAKRVQTQNEQIIKSAAGVYETGSAVDFYA